jgi:hypothetical protein
MNRKSSLMSLVALLLGLVLVSDLAAKPPQGKGGRGGKPDNEAQERKEDREDLRDLEAGIDLVSGLLSVDDARKIARGAGATGYKELPPGVRKNLARGKPMPPGIAKTRMPGGMLDQLPKRKGYDWQIAGTDLLLVQAGSNIVSDVLKDVFK